MDVTQPAYWQGFLNAALSRQQGQVVGLIGHEPLADHLEKYPHSPLNSHSNDALNDPLNSQRWVIKYLSSHALENSPQTTLSFQHESNFQHELEVYQRLKGQPFCPDFTIYQAEQLQIVGCPQLVTGQVLLLPYLHSIRHRFSVQQQQAAQPNSDIAPIELVLKVCNAVAELHRQGVIHADLKLSHLYLASGQIQLIDFAQSVAMDSPKDHPDTAGMTATPAYMAPELFLGQGVSKQSDLYALGIIFYEILMGEKPYRARSYRNWAVAHCQTEIPLLPPQWAKYQIVLDGMLAKRRENRYQNIDLAINALNLIKKT